MYMSSQFKKGSKWFHPTLVDDLKDEAAYEYMLALAVKWIPHLKDNGWEVDTIHEHMERGLLEYATSTSVIHTFAVWLLEEHERIEEKKFTIMDLYGLYKDCPIMKGNDNMKYLTFSKAVKDTFEELGIKRTTPQNKPTYHLPKNRDKLTPILSRTYSEYLYKGDK